MSSPILHRVFVDLKTGEWIPAFHGRSWSQWYFRSGAGYCALMKRWIGGRWDYEWKHFD